MDALELLQKGHPDKTWRRYWDTQIEKETIISDEFMATLKPSESARFITDTKRPTTGETSSVAKIGRKYAPQDESKDVR